MLRRPKPPSSPPSSLSIAAAVAAACLASGCAQVRRFSIVTTPPDAAVAVDGKPVERLDRPLSLAFSSPEQTFTIVASRYGYDETSVPVTLQTPEGPLPIAMRPKVKPLTINVEPVPATLSLDGQTITTGPVGTARYDLPYSTGADLRTRPHVLRAERNGFAPVQTTISYDDKRDAYTLRLGTLAKDFAVDTSPTGAQLSLDGVDVGVAPLRLANQPFAYDAAREQYVPRVLIATKAGYPPTRMEIAWDDGQPAYGLPLGVFKKTARIVTDPPDARVKIDGRELPRGSDGARTIPLEFRPVDDAGTLKTYVIDATVSHAGEQWTPLRATLAWDDGRPQYALSLNEILIRNVPTRRVDFVSKDGRWQPTLVESVATAWKDVADAGFGKATRITDLPAGSSIDSFALSPDGSQVAYALVDSDAKRPRSRIYVARVDGGGGNATALTSGKQLDLTPTFSPAGDAVVFSSDRGGGPMQIWSIPLDGQSGATRLTNATADHLWPSLDSSAKPRVFYESLIPGQDVPRLFSTPVGTAFETDLVASGGAQPRLSPRDDAIAFVQTNDQTGKTDVLRAGDRGGVTQKLTDTPDVSESDPAWSPDATHVAMSAIRPPTGATTRPAQSEIVTVDAAGGALKPVTQNDATDDQPTWSPTGDAIYFRSDRGGKWDVWRIDVK